MLGTPHTRFSWAKADRLPELTFFRILLKRRRPPLPAPRRQIVAKKRMEPRKWKPAVWTPWLWVK